MTLPIGIVRDIFAKEHPDRLLHLLAESGRPILYTEARDALNLHAQQFARALRSLEKWGLVQLRVVPRKDRPDDRRRVKIELTTLGAAAVQVHETMDREWRTITEKQGLTE